MDIRQLYSIIKRWVWLIILGGIIGAGLGYYFSNRETRIYEAETRFIILTAAPTSEFQIYYNYLDSEKLISTYTELLSAQSTLQQASEELGFPVSAGFASAEQVGETQFIRLTVKHSDPTRAAAIANGLVDILIDQNEELQSVRYITTEENLQSRIEQAEQQIESIQLQIKNATTATVQNSIGEVLVQIEDLQNEINDIESKIAIIDPLFATPEEQARLIDYQDQLEQLQPILEKYQEIYTNLVVLGDSADQNINESSQITQLEFTLQLYRDIYISSIASLESLRLSQAQSTPKVVQTEPAAIPQNPISPKPLQTAALACAVGLLAMGGLSFAVEYLDDTIKTPEDINQLVGLPVIGYVGDLNANRRLKNENNTEHVLFTSSQPRSVVSEAMRSLRTNLEFSAIDEPIKSILITSGTPEEGKSTIAANFAMVVAQSGKKTLLLDADMRRPSAHKFFDISNRIGLSDLLRGKLPLDRLISSLKDQPNLSVLTSGRLPPDPTELLSSERMETLIEEFESKFDVIIIDCSPMVVADPQILASKVSGVIYIVQPGKIRTQQLTTPIEQLQRINARLLGIVFNRISNKSDSYYGGYYYYSSYNKDGE